MRGSHHIWVGLTEEVQSRGHPRKREESDKKIIGHSIFCCMFHTTKILPCNLPYNFICLASSEDQERASFCMLFWWCIALYSPFWTSNSKNLVYPNIFFWLNFIFTGGARTGDICRWRFGQCNLRWADKHNKHEPPWPSRWTRCRFAERKTEVDPTLVSACHSAPLHWTFGELTFKFYMFSELNMLKYY